MRRIYYKQLSQPNFTQAFQKLMQMPMKDPAMFRLVHIGKKLQDARKQMKDSYHKNIVEPYAVVDEHGPVQPDDKCMELQLPFKAKDGMEKVAAEASEKFGDHEVCLKYNPLTQAELLSLGAWSSAEIIALEPVLSLEEPETAGADVVPLKQ
jgi:hypothetical protein